MQLMLDASWDMVVTAGRYPLRELRTCISWLGVDLGYGWKIDKKFKVIISMMLCVVQW